MDQTLGCPSLSGRCFLLVSLTSVLNFDDPEEDREACRQRRLSLLNSSLSASGPPPLPALSPESDRHRTKGGGGGLLQSPQLMFGTGRRGDSYGVFSVAKNWVIVNHVLLRAHAAFRKRKALWATVMARTTATTAAASATGKGWHAPHCHCRSYPSTTGCTCRCDAHERLRQHHSVGHHTPLYSCVRTAAMFWAAGSQPACPAQHEDMHLCTGHVPRTKHVPHCAAQPQGRSY